MFDTVINLPNGRFLLVPASILTKMHKYRQRKPETTEQGGLLFGVMRAEYNEPVSIENPPCIELVGMTEPCALDHATRTQFVRRCNHHLVEIQSASSIYKNLVYLGEWHTHPQVHPTPSAIDMSSWKKAFKNKIVVFAIVGQETDWWGLWMEEKVCKIEVLHDTDQNM